MSRFLCMQRRIKTSQPAAKPIGKPSPAEMQDKYAQFNAWKEKFEKNIVDMGGRLGAGTLVTDDSAKDGPLVEVKELVGGYMILEAESLDHAIEIARGLPGMVSPGSGVEVIEISVS